MKDILTGIGAALLISLCIVFVLGCYNSQDEFDEVSRSIDKQIEMVGAMNRTIDAMIKQTDKAIKKSREINRMIGEMSPTTNDYIDHQECRQNIADLQNRVYELENE